MQKIKCKNPICLTSFFFNEKKNPIATKVRCPKCKNIQALSVALEPQEEVEEWLRHDSRDVSSSPEVLPLDKEKSEIPNGKENFLGTDPNPTPSLPPDKKPPVKEKEIGWLIVHDENTETATFHLRKGINRIGRQSQTTPRDVNIAIRTSDQYISREHCDIEVKWRHDKNGYDYILTDRGSANGTFVNAGKRLSRSEDVMLSDGDTIQAGRTKLVLKLPSTFRNSQDAEDWVKSSEYTATII
jgi:FHA domain